MYLSIANLAYNRNNQANFFFFDFFYKDVICAFYAFIDRTAVEWTGNESRDKGNDMQQRATGWNRTCGNCSDGTASVHEALALLNELPGRTIRLVFFKFILNFCIF